MSLPSTSSYSHSRFEEPISMSNPGVAAFTATGLPDATPTRGSSSEPNATKRAPKRRGRISTKPKPPFACLICGKQFKRHEHMSRHQATHSEDTKYPCSICGKTFRRQDVMHRHTLTHSGAHRSTSSSSRATSRSLKTKTSRQTVPVAPYRRPKQTSFPCELSKLHCNGGAPCSQCTNHPEKQCGPSGSSSIHSPVVAATSLSEGTDSPLLDHQDHHLGSPHETITRPMPHSFTSLPVQDYAQHMMHQPHPSLHPLPHLPIQHPQARQFSQAQSVDLAYSQAEVAPFLSTADLSDSTANLVSSGMPAWSSNSWTRTVQSDLPFATSFGSSVPASTSFAIGASPISWQQQQQQQQQYGYLVEYDQTPRPSTSGSTYGHGETEEEYFFPASTSESGGSDFSVESLDGVSTPTSSEIANHSELHALAMEAFIGLSSPALTLTPEPEHEPVKLEWNPQPSDVWHPDALSPLPMINWSTFSGLSF